MHRIRDGGSIYGRHLHKIIYQCYLAMMIYDKDLTESSNISAENEHIETNKDGRLRFENLLFSLCRSMLRHPCRTNNLVTFKCIYNLTRGGRIKL